jgi:hypothetical protein
MFRWVDLPFDPILRTPASFGLNFRVTLTDNTILEPPHGGMPGQRILWRFSQDAVGGRIVTPNTGGFTVRGQLALPTTADSVGFYEAMYDNTTGLWDLWSIPPVPSTGWAGVGHIPTKTLDAGTAVLADVANTLATLLEELKTSGILRS